MGSHVVYRKVTGASPNSSNNPTPISSSVLNGESPTEPDTQSASNVPVIKVNGRLTPRNIDHMSLMTVRMMALSKKINPKGLLNFQLTVVCMYW